jgi:predicted dehydrogenase
MARQWKAAVVGTGVVGEWHVRLIPKLPNSKLVAVCDVICEKPLEIELGRIDQMIAAAKAHGVGLAGVFQNRWNDANRAIKDAADEGRFGKLAWAGCFTPWYRTDKYYDEGGWRGTWKLDGGGAVMNQSVHAIDLLQWIVGPVAKVSAYAAFRREERIHPSIEVEDILTCALQFKGGAFGTIMGTTGMYPGMPPRIEVGGDKGTAVSEGGLKMFAFADPRPGDQELLQRFVPSLSDAWKAKIQSTGGEDLLEKLGAKRAAASGGGSSNRDVGTDFHARNIMHILRAWEEGRDAETAAAEARKAVAIVLAMYESARKGGVSVDVP